MATETEKAWLAGIIDGEGTIFLYRGGDKKSIPVFRVFLVNSSMPMMLQSARIMSDIVGTDVRIKQKIYNPNTVTIKSNLDMWVIEICKQKMVLDILTSIEPYLVAKKTQAQFHIYHLSRHVRGSKWLDSEIRAIFSRPVTTERETPIANRVEPQSELAGNCKSTAEMTVPVHLNE